MFEKKKKRQLEVVGPPYQWVQHPTDKIQPTSMEIIWEKKILQIFKKQNLNLPCTKYYIESTWIKWCESTVLGTHV